jgi:VWFA-related protein
MKQGSTKTTPHPRPRSILAILFATALALCPGAIPQTAPPQVQSTPSPTGPQYTIRTRVPLTIVDVTVTDAEGHPVHGLKRSDFTLLEDNHPMQFQSFDEHRTDTAVPAPELIQQALPPNTFTNTAPTARNPAPPTMLVIDNLNTPAQAQQQVTQRLLDFARKMPSGTQMAVFLLTTHLAIVQGFTSDHSLIEAALSDKRVTAQESPIADPNTPEAGEHTEVEGNQNSMRGQYTLTAMRQIARYAAGIPGRKNLVWFSGAFPTTFPPAQDPYAFPPSFCPANEQVPCIQPTIYDFVADVKYITDLLARAHVTVYPIDARGIQIPDPPVRNPLSTTGMTNRMNLRVAEHGTMDTVAEGTGGKAVYNSNDFAGALQDAIENGSNYYTITYAPTDQSLDTRFRAITVKVSQPNLHLTYRNGYYAVAPDTDTNGRKIENVTPMQSAMMRGTLPATQILFRVKVVESPTSTTLSTDNQPDPKRMKPPYRHYSVSYLIDVHGINFAPGDDGNYRGKFEYGVRVYNADGDEIVNATSKTVKPIIVPAVYQSMLQTGANARRDIDVPATGNYFLRIAVHDLSSDRVGSIEIPTASINPAAAGAP